MSAEQGTPTGSNISEQVLKNGAAREFKQLVDTSKRSSSLNSEQFFTAVQHLVTMTGPDRDYEESDEGTKVNQSLLMEDAERKALHGFAFRTNSFIDQGIITVFHESGVREVVFGFAKQAFSGSKETKCFASYTHNDNTDSAIYNALLTGKVETAEPGETELRYITGNQMIAVLDRLQAVYERQNGTASKPNVENEETVFDASSQAA